MCAEHNDPLAGRAQHYLGVCLYKSNQFDKAQAAFEKLPQGWLADDAYVYVECSADVPLPALPAGWTVYRSKQAGQVGYHLLRATAATR